jgi:GNAT superfamily N-acetyltransferase
VTNTNKASTYAPAIAELSVWMPRKAVPTCVQDLRQTTVCGRDFARNAIILARNYQTLEISIASATTPTSRGWQVQALHKTESTMPHDGIKIRDFFPDDAVAVRELFIRVNRLMAPSDMTGAFELYIARSLIEEIDRLADYYGERNGGFWVAVDGQKVVGMFGLEAVGEAAMELRRMYVDPDLRRRGIGKRMLHFAEQECRKRNRSRIDLSTSELQRDALSLYLNAGYDQVRDEVAVTASNKTLGGGIRRYYLTKIL